jgi:hypothetical protein
MATMTMPMTGVPTMSTVRVHRAMRAPLSTTR